MPSERGRELVEKSPDIEKVSARHGSVWLTVGVENGSGGGFWSQARRRVLGFALIASAIISRAAVMIWTEAFSSQRRGA